MNTRNHCMTKKLDNLYEIDKFLETYKLVTQKVDSLYRHVKNRDGVKSFLKVEDWLHWCILLNI